MDYAQQSDMQQQQAHALAMQQQQQQQQMQMQAVYANANGGLQGQQQQVQQQQQQVGVVSHAPKRSSKGGGVGGQQHPPSKVLHIRGLPPYTSESDVVSFFSAMPGVSVTRILLLPNSNQAFLQLASPGQAAHLCALQQQQGGHFLLKPNKAIIVQFSNRHEVHTPATMAAAGISGGTIGVGPVGAGGLQSAAGGGHDSQQQANSILIVTVLNTRVPVTLDHIHQIFKVRESARITGTHRPCAHYCASILCSLSVRLCLCCVLSLSA